MSDITMTTKAGSAEALAQQLSDAPERFDALCQEYPGRIIKHSFNVKKQLSPTQVATEKSTFFFVDNGNGDLDENDVIVRLHDNKATVISYSFFSEFRYEGSIKHDEEHVPLVYKAPPSFPAHAPLPIPHHLMDYMSRHIFADDVGPCFKDTDIDGWTVNDGCILFGFQYFMQKSFPDQKSTDLTCQKPDTDKPSWYCYKD